MTYRKLLCVCASALILTLAADADAHHSTRRARRGGQANQFHPNLAYLNPTGEHSSFRLDHLSVTLPFVFMSNGGTSHRYGSHNLVHVAEQQKHYEEQDRRGNGKPWGDAAAGTAWHYVMTPPGKIGRSSTEVDEELDITDLIK